MSIQKPLSEIIRPSNLSEFIGQPHILKKLESMINNNSYRSLLFFGPPGCGKSTLAILLAKSTNKKFVRISAPETSVSHLRSLIADTPVIILDEIHRLSKAQQDFFLPYLERGDILLFATTTENPSFCITKQLISRLHIFRLRPLTKEELKKIAQKGVEYLNLKIPEETLDMLINLCGGDARTLLNFIEYCSTLKDEDLEAERIKHLLPEIVQRGDRGGDTHFELASALIKSIRGSDPDAALYYLAGMLESGEDPIFICRRLIISASEDIGLADPYALVLAVSCLHAVEAIGMPEGFIPLAETVTYLALAPKSNSTYSAYLSAVKEIRTNGLKSVPLHLRNPSTQLHKQWGYGRGYKYPHDYPDSWVDQQYLPEELKGKVFYHPKNQGQEPRLNLWLKSRKKKLKTK